MLRESITTRRLKFILVLVVITNICSAQVPTPIVKIKNGRGSAGYFFVFPFKMSEKITLKESTMLILDGAGKVLCYKRSDWASDFKLHANGLMSIFRNGKFYLMNEHFRIVDSVYCQGGIATDSHDFILLPDGHYLLLGTETVGRSWSKKPVSVSAVLRSLDSIRVKYGVVQELDEKKNIVFQWSSKNIHEPEDADAFYLKDTNTIDLTHFNSVDMDDRGNILVSSRYFNEVLKIRRSDSSLVWRMGGKRNQIHVLNDTVPFFGQHDARFTGQNSFTVFDNGYSFDSLKHNVRVLEYRVDDSSGTAQCIWSYSNERRIIGEATGNAQKLHNGDVLVSYGKIESGIPNITFEVVDRNKKKLVEVYFNDTMGTYRTYYYEQLPFEISRPALDIRKQGGASVLRTKKPFRFYRWSNGKNTPEADMDKEGEYYVDVSDDGELFFRSEIKKAIGLKRAAAPGTGRK